MLYLNQLIFFIVLFVNYKIKFYTCLNSYIYLSDKYINEEIPIGSQILDLVDELNSYFSKITVSASSNTVGTNIAMLSEVEKKSILELKTQLRNQQYTFLEDIKQQTSDQTYFLLDLITGRITTKRYLDRESMCLNKHCLETCDALSINSNSNNNNNHVKIGNATASSHRGNNCKMNLKILLIPSYNIISLNIIVQDINDNRPYFSTETLNQTIPENVPIGHKIPIDLAYDADTGINSVQYYKLINLELGNGTNEKIAGDDAFELVQNLDELQLALVVRKKLDREIKAFYHYLLIAYDGGQPVPYSGQLEIYLIISDINDNNPKFKQDLYTFTLSEDTLVGAQIGQIEALDLDDGLNGLIKYTIVNVNNDNLASASAPLVGMLMNGDENENKYFDLNETTGVLTLKSELDYEIEQFYSLTIEAKDCGVGSLPAYTQVEIFVLDFNDNAPEISVSFLNSLYKNHSSTNQLEIYLSESIGQNKYLAHVSIFDKDSFDNGRTDWKVFVNNNELNAKKQQLIQINKLNNNSFTINTGILSNSTTLPAYDRETLSSFKVSILAWDFGKPESKYTYYNFTVNLLDENDNAPKFSRGEYSFIIYENNPMKYVIGELSATDTDLDENSRITYKIKEPEYEKYFSIDPVTGILSAVKSLDREDKQIYRFQVLASDHGKPPLTSSVFVRVDLIDLNDNAPKIIFNTSYLSKEQLPNKDTIVINLDEDMAIDTLIIKFSADDPDDGENGKAKFSIKKYIKYDVEHLPFKLLPNGELRLHGKLDREKQDKYELIIQCQDYGSVKAKSLTSEMNLLIYINDVNDNCPQGIHLKNESKTTFLNKDTLFPQKNVIDSKRQHIIFNNEYSDADLGLNSELKFDLLTYQELFDLEENLVRLKVNQLSYKIQIKLKNTNMSNGSSNNNKLMNNNLNLKLGKYVIKLRISDKGEPSCSMIDNYILIIGDNEFKTKEDILLKIKKQQEQLQQHRNDENSQQALLLLDLQADSEEDDSMLNNSKLIQTIQNSKLNEKSLVKSKLKHQQAKLTHSDYLLLIAIISIIIIVLIFFTLLCTIYFYNRYNKKASLKVIEKDNLLKKPDNYENHNQMNSEILYNNDNRFSLSFKSTDTEQSNSADSITSSTLTKDTKTSSLLSSNQPHQKNDQFKTVTYSTISTFQRLNETPVNGTLKKDMSSHKKLVVHDHNNNNSNNGTIKYSAVNGFISNTLDSTYKSTGNNYKSILKDTSSCANGRVKRYDNNVKIVNDNLNQTNIDSLDSNEYDEESTSFLKTRIPNLSHLKQFDYKSSAV